MMSDTVPKTERRWWSAWILSLILMTGIGVAAWCLRPVTKPPTKASSLEVIEREDQLELARGRRAAEQGDFESALQHVEKSLFIQPENISGNLLKAELLFRLHRTDEMRFPLESVLAQDPDHFEAHANLAFALRFCGLLDEAEKHVTWCLSRRADFFPARRIRAEILRDRGDSDGALAEIREVIAAIPGDLDSHLLEAELLMYQREFESAYQNLLPLEPQFRAQHRYAALMARLTQVTGRKDEAAQYQAILESLANPRRRRTTRML